MASSWWQQAILQTLLLCICVRISLSVGLTRAERQGSQQEGPINYLANEKNFGEFERLLTRRGSTDDTARKLNSMEVNSFTTSLVMLRNQMAMFTGNVGREAFETMIRGSAADIYLHTMEVLNPDPEQSKKPNILNSLMSIMLNWAGALMHWSEQTIHLEMPNSKELSERFTEAQAIVRDLSSRLLNGESISDDDRRKLKEAIEKLDELEEEFSTPNHFKLHDLTQMLTSRIKEILQKIVNESEENQNPTDFLSKQVDIIGDLITINWDKKNPLRRLFKTLLLGLVRTQVPKIRELIKWVDKTVRNTHAKINDGSSFPEEMLYLMN